MEWQKKMEEHLTHMRQLQHEALSIGAANLPLVQAWGAMAQANATAALALAVAFSVSDVESALGRLSAAVERMD